MSFVPELLERIPFDESDMQSLERAIAVRWQSTFNRWRITLALPLIIAIIIAAIFYVLEYRYVLFNIEPPIFESPPNPLKPIFFVMPVLVLVTIANFVLFVATIPPIYTDKRKGMKERILFVPEPYTIDDPIQIEEMQRFYIKTGIHEFPFFEVDFYNFCAAIAVPYLIMELTPKTRILLGIRTREDENIIMR